MAATCTSIWTSTASIEPKWMHSSCKMTINCSGNDQEWDEVPCCFHHSGIDPTKGPPYIKGKAPCSGTLSAIHCTLLQYMTNITNMATLTMLTLWAFLCLTMVTYSSATCDLCLPGINRYCCSQLGLCCPVKPGACAANPFPDVSVIFKCNHCFDDSNCVLQQKCCPFGATTRCCRNPLPTTSTTVITPTPTGTATTPTGTATTPTTPVAG